MPNRPRAIIYLRLDVFFTSVEELENPDLVGKPVLVGGRPEGVGIVAAASYPAQQCGVRPEMRMRRALTVCPQAIVIPPRYDLYQDYLRRVVRILHDMSPLVEQIGVDEAYLDLTSAVEPWDEAVEIAKSLQRRVKKEIGLPISLGVATNKLIAKLAPDRDQPGEMAVVTPGEEAVFLTPLPVRVLRGVGLETERRLAALGVTTVGELAHLPEEELRARLGRYGIVLSHQAKGIDQRPVVAHREQKSVSHERTLDRDTGEMEALQDRLWRLSQGVAQRLKTAEVAARTVAVKLQYADHSTLVRQMSLTVPTDDERGIYRTADVLLNRAWDPGRSVRLLGVAGLRLSPPTGQLPLL